ncbi:MAG: amidohydrolase [Candidatus Methylomirabilia bacterium]
MGTTKLLVNATVVTMERARPVAQAVAIRDGRIAAVGSEEELSRQQAGAEVVDLGGATVIPGFVDPHNHFAVAALERFWADCRTPPLKTIPEVQAALRVAAGRAPEGAWVRGWGYHHARLAERRHPTRYDLDEAVPDRPALLMHFSYHQCVVNSRALAAAGVSRGTQDPAGGEIGRDRSGEPTGLLFERAMGLAERASREGWEARFGEGAAAASRRYASQGITTVQDAAVGAATERRYVEAEGAGQLTIRVERMAVNDSGWFDAPGSVVGVREGTGVLKLFVDGGYRCAMRLRREGREATSGFLFYRPGDLADLLVVAWRAGWRVTCHAIGNWGVEVAVEAVEQAMRREPGGRGRVRIDHAVFLTRDLVRRIRTLEVFVVTQPNFVYDLGGRNARLPSSMLYLPFGSLLRAGVPLAFSSDYPCGSLGPLMGICAAVTRESPGGHGGDPDEAISVQAALEAYTIGAARAAGLGEECGSVEAGKRADLVVLEANPLEVPPERLPGLRVFKTLVVGREVWPS